MKNLREVLEESAARSPGKAFLVFRDQELTYGDFARAVQEVACGFQALGLRKGDKVALLLPNGFEFPQCWLALNTIGAVMVPVNNRFVEDEIAYVLKHSDARAVVTSGHYLETILKLRADLPLLEHVVAVEDSGPAGVLPLPALRREGGEPEKVPLAPSDDAVILYTSGTTGKPKGCLAAHEYFVDLAATQGEVFQLTGEDRVYTAQPFYYMDPQWNTVMALLHNATLVIAEKFSTSRFWDDVIRNRVTAFYCIGSMTSFLYNMPPSPRDRSHGVRIVQTSGIAPSIHREWEQRFGVPVLEAYGSTETAADMAVCLGTDRKAGTGCIGKPVAYREAKVFDEQGREVPRGAVGEIVLKRGRGMMKGYYKDPAATEQAFEGGWFHTGDLGYVDADGDFHFSGRKKDIIRRAGENISAASIEHILITHPKILDAAALPVPDKVRGEEVKVYVVPRPGEVLTAEEVVAFCEASMAEYKVPRYVEMRETLPKTASERVQKEKLKAEKADLAAGCYDRMAAKGPAAAS
ncbi:MAG: AMP-binding protein [Deltaproteobacteria bacterium]|nr:AMP-binding protein [Deltaproteobacteria bacterium]